MGEEARSISLVTGSLTCRECFSERRQHLWEGAQLVGHAVIYHKWCLNVGIGSVAEKG